MRTYTHISLYLYIYLSLSLYIYIYIERERDANTRRLLTKSCSKRFYEFEQTTLVNDDMEYAFTIEGFPWGNSNCT